MTYGLRSSDARAISATCSGREVVEPGARAKTLVLDAIDCHGRDSVDGTTVLRIPFITLMNVCVCLLFESRSPIIKIFPKLENDQLKGNSDYGTAYKLCDVACVSRPPSFLKGVRVSHILNLHSYLLSGTDKPRLCRSAIASLMYSTAVSLKSCRNGNELMEAISQ